jgi:two-component system, LytTR family, sensor kinase
MRNSNTRNSTNRKVLGHTLFWLILLLYYISSFWPLESDKVFLFEKMFMKVLVDMALTYCVIFLLVPLYLNRKRWVLFTLYSLISVYLAYVAYQAVRCFYLVPKYPEVFQMRPPLVFEERITNVFIFLNNITGVILPTIILMLFEYYRHQKELISLKEQKRTSELEALKNQLNPHFLFNTLNNLYALAIKKSDQTPEVIAKLSEILDYILYRCNDDFVPIKNEVELLDNYIVLEKLRYGSRLSIQFEHDIQSNVRIAPLLLLAFLENAFKHGVAEEVKEAHISIHLKANIERIVFRIENSKPHIPANVSVEERQPIGLANIRKQLEILYSDHYKLEIEEGDDKFAATLTIDKTL